jgi:hypothetical protein
MAFSSSAWPRLAVRVPVHLALRKFPYAIPYASFGEEGGDHAKYLKKTGAGAHGFLALSCTGCEGPVLRWGTLMGTPIKAPELNKEPGDI